MPFMPRDRPGLASFKLSDADLGASKNRQTKVVLWAAPSPTAASSVPPRPAELFAGPWCFRRAGTRRPRRGPCGHTEARL